MMSSISTTVAFQIFCNVIILTWIQDAESALSGWSSSPTQYHVQTDEGPDRFFRYQTFNGQYRKERRMDDGTVIGSYGWVDPSGFLRMTDYIADGKGFRVVKSRTEFVGVKPEPVEEKPKRKPLKHSTRVIRQRHPEFISPEPITTTNVPTTTYEAPTVSYQNSASATATSVYDTPAPSTQVPNIVPATYLTLPSVPTTISVAPTSLSPEKAKVLVTPTPQRPEVFRYSPSPKSINIKPSNENHGTPLKRRIIKVYMRRQHNHQNASGATQTVSSVAPPQLQTSPPVTLPTPPASAFSGNRPYIIQVTRGGESSGGRNDVFKGYATPLRSGNSGFLYKIPNQYHKEETEKDGSRVGSFGYVDPFGIRRVIHYNAGNTGFAHEVDFKYVGKENQQ